MLTTIAEFKSRYPLQVAAIEADVRVRALERKVARLEERIAEQDQHLVAEIAAILEEQQPIL